MQLSQAKELIKAAFMMGKGMSKKGQVANFVYMAIAVILGIGLAVPITKSVVSTANLTGIDAVIAQFLSTLIIVGVLMGIVYGTIIRGK